MQQVNIAPKVNPIPVLVKAGQPVVTREPQEENLAVIIAASAIIKERVPAAQLTQPGTGVNSDPEGVIRTLLQA